MSSSETATIEGLNRRAHKATVLAETRRRAYDAGEFVDQENLMTASEILRLAESVGAATGVRLVDLCCGIVGPGRFLVERTGCRLLGIDRDIEALAYARSTCHEPGAGDAIALVAGTVDRLPLAGGTVQAAILLETLLSLEDKRSALNEIRRVMIPGARLGLTLEAGEPLTSAERRRLPDGEATWIVP